MGVADRDVLTAGVVHLRAILSFSQVPGARPALGRPEVSESVHSLLRVEHICSVHIALILEQVLLAAVDMAFVCAYDVVSIDDHRVLFCSHVAQVSPLGKACPV